MYKVGDRVKTIQKIQPHTKEDPIAVEGEISRVSTDEVQVELDVQTEYGHRCGFGLLRYFKLSDLLAFDVLRLRKGDKIMTVSNTNTLLAPGDVYVVEDDAPVDYLNLGARRVSDGGYVSLTRSTCTKVTDLVVPLLAESSGLAPSKPRVGPPGWTFRATKENFDGARVLRELHTAGADYAVVIWGRGDTDRRALVHTRLYNRLSAARLTEGISSHPVWSVGPSTPKAAHAASVALNYHTVTRNGKPATWAQLKALMADLAKAEERRKTFTTYVAYGKVDG